jgi:hypothetical protein
MPMKAAITRLEPAKQKEVIDMIASGATYTAIARKLGCTVSSAQGYIFRNLMPLVCRDLMKREGEGARKILARVERIAGRCEKMSDALDLWLTDPDNPDRYTMDPRTDELKCICTLQGTNSAGKPISRTATIPLNELMSQLEFTEYRGLSVIPEHLVWKNTDPRKLMLDTARALKELLELLAKITGELKESVDVHVDVRTQLSSIVQVINAELEDEPEKKQRIVEAIDASIN